MGRGPRLSPGCFTLKLGAWGDLLTVPLVSTSLRYLVYAEKEDVLEKEGPGAQVWSGTMH